MSLKDIFCQDRALDALQRAYKAERVPHAYIFAGNEGVGKQTFALELAKLLLCHQPVESDGFVDSCGKCRSCELFEAGSHPDFQLVYKELREFTRDGKNKAAPIDMPVDVVREFLIEKVPSKPKFSKSRVFVLTECEKVNNSSQNALLKVLEEPPEFCYIILLCTKMDKLLPTIKSRCQTLRFGPVSEEKIIEKLSEFDIGSLESRFFARFTHGSIGRACMLAELESSSGQIFQIRTEIIENLAKMSYDESLDLAAQFHGYAKSISGAWSKLLADTSTTDINRRAMKLILEMINSALTDAMKMQTLEQPLINADIKDQIQRIGVKLDPETCARGIENNFMVFNWIDSSVNEKLIFEQVLLNLSGCGKI